MGRETMKELLKFLQCLGYLLIIQKDSLIEITHKEHFSFVGSKIEEWKKEMEILQRRKRLAVRTAESEYADLTDLETDNVAKKKRNRGKRYHYYRMDIVELTVKVLIFRGLVVLNVISE